MHGAPRNDSRANHEQGRSSWAGLLALRATSSNAKRRSQLEGVTETFWTIGPTPSTSRPRGEAPRVILVPLRGFEPRSRG